MVLQNKENKENNNKLTILSMVGPTGIWLFLFLLLPLIYVLAISFATRSQYGGVEWKFSLDSYKQIFNPLYMKVVWKSIVLAFNSSWICLVISYPFAFLVSKVEPKKRAFLLLLIMLPFWVNGLIRLNGWANILRDSGIINNILMKFGIISSPIKMLYTDNSVLFGMIYEFFPFMILPLQTSISKIDSTLIEAANDLGAKKVHTFFRVIFPLTLPGIFAGTIQVFIPSLGAFYVSDVMGGGNSTYLGNLVQNQFMVARNWCFGAAFSVLLIVFTLVIIKLYSKVGNMDELA
ncbi:ABC transporter permease [Clostridium tyrobutyricum]|uniref:ABC transporter permease n=1 Tax=Clostridium tyrobutyricum TaxID=1519 RepID=UPI0010AA0912|nr:ABC transporter permease [Clostridium tyrobutyricum]MBR9647963.1 ABC transporter permease [Clostridium tyrobutyricum]QCH27044.1 Spermidine, putrescine transport system permease [Clostridium tyrobutyricum]